VLFEACDRNDWALADTLRADFMPLEDLRDGWGPARVLHHATELAGIAPTGPIPPYVSPLDESQLRRLAPVAASLRKLDA
jgi:dihydrodipicolinate synthase/N-acetylneuraminate lyase